MIKKTLILGGLFLCLFSKSQEASVEKNLFGFQVGVLNVNAQYETRLARKLALRAEIGLYQGGYSWDNYLYENGTFVKEEEYETLIAPRYTLEPMYYYNLDRREKLGKNTKKNSGNYFSLKTYFDQNRAELYNSNDTHSVVNSLYVIPKYGIRRNFAKHFNYEFSFGVGWEHNFIGSNGCSCDENEFATDIQARIGVNF